MLLRSGTLKDDKCPQCHMFYPHRMFKYKCSNCVFEKKNVWNSDEFQVSLHAWVQAELYRTSSNTRRAIEQLFTVAARSKSSGLLKDAAKICQNMHIQFTAEFAYDICRKLDFCMTGGPNVHQILPFVIDWWNIRKWVGCEAIKCYYARMEDPLHLLITSIPPPPPYRSFS